MTIRHLRVFVAVATTGKMCDAANELFISQPTVSQAIKELEEYYNTLLFERLGRKLHITEAGKDLLFYASNLLKDFDDIEKKMLAISEHRKINIGATITVGNCILPELINSLKEAHPNIDTYACIANTNRIEEMILNSEIDLGIIEGNINNPSLISITALDDYLVLACSKNHTFAQRDKIKLEDLKNQDFILREEGSGTRKLFEDYINNKGIPINVVLQSNCPGSIKRSILLNNFLSVMSIRLIEDEVKSGEMCFFKCTDDYWHRGLKIVYHKDKFKDPVLKDLISIFENFDNKYKKDVLQGKDLIG